MVDTAGPAGGLDSLAQCPLMHRVVPSTRRVVPAVCIGHGPRLEVVSCEPSQNRFSVEPHVMLFECSEQFRRNSSRSSNCMGAGTGSATLTHD